MEEPPEEPGARAPRPPDMVGHLHLQGMEESLKEKSREGLLDSPDSGLPPSPSPSPPFYSLAPGILDARAGGAGASSEPPGPGEARAVSARLHAQPGRGRRGARGRSHRAPTRGALEARTGSPPPRTPGSRPEGVPATAVLRGWVGDTEVEGVRPDPGTWGRLPSRGPLCGVIVLLSALEGWGVREHVQNPQGSWLRLGGLEPQAAACSRP